MTDLARSERRIDSSQGFRAGAKAILPIVLGVVPFGMIYGVLAVAAGLPPLLAQAMSAIVFAGSAQFIGVQLIGSATPAAVILLTTFVVNLRHLLYSASVAPYLKHLPVAWKGLLAYLLTDEAYAVAILHFRNKADAGGGQQWYFLGAGLTLWSAWQLSTGVGIFLGAQVPASWALDFTLALTFIAIVIPTLKQRADLGAAFVAGVTAVATMGLPYKLGLLVAALAGIVTGVVLERESA